MDEKRILIEFIGGDWDGKTLDSHSPDKAERMYEQSCLFLTRDGTVGKAFHGFSMIAFDRMRKGEISMDDAKPSGRKTHKYTVTERLDEGDEVLIRLKYSIRDPDQEKPKE